MSDIRNLLYEGKEGSVNLKPVYKRLNMGHFGGALPMIKLAWSGRLTNAVGKAFVAYVQRGRKMSKKMSMLINRYSETIPTIDAEIDMSSLKITMSSKYDLTANDIDAVMLHEMVHIKLFIEKKINGHHGTPEFDGWIKKLRADTGLDIPYKESAFKKSPKIKAKEGFIMLLRQSDGKYGIATFTPQWMKKNWMEFAEVMTRIMNGGAAGGRLQSMVYYKIKHRVIADYPAKRSLRRISWVNIDDELADELKKKGKYWGESFIGGGKFSPQLVQLVHTMPKGVSEIELDKRGQPAKVS
jgi:hypothetical protein